MPLKIKPGERVGNAIERSARDELRAAAKAIDDEAQPLGERVHEVRTATKKLRALTRLVRPASGRPSRRADRRLRKIARAVSAVRDAEVLLDTLDGLVAELPGPRGDSLGEARARFAARLERRARPFVDEEEARRLRRRLRKERRRVRRWAPSGNRWRAIGRGFSDGYRRARRTMSAAYDEGRPAAAREAAFHDWRRAVKSHRHQTQLLSAISPARLGGRLGDLDTLGELLGDEHDLTVLAEALRRERSCFSKAGDCDRVLAALDDRRRRLREQALPLGVKLFADRPRDFRRLAKAEFHRYRRRPGRTTPQESARAA